MATEKAEAAGYGMYPARIEEASDIAALIDIAGHGLPSWLWSSVFERDEGVSVFELGRERARRDSGGFSWRNAWVARKADSVAGMVLGYSQPDTIETGSLDDLPAIIRPLVELEAEAPGSWYLNAIATYREHRGRGVGAMLMEQAARLARESGAPEVSLIVEDINETALRLYRRHGFTARAKRPFVPFPSGPRATNWVLMTCPLR